MARDISSRDFERLVASCARLISREQRLVKFFSLDLEWFMHRAVSSDQVLITRICTAVQTYRETGEAHQLDELLEKFDELGLHNRR